MTEHANPIQLGHEESKVSERLRTRLIALLLLWTAAVVTVLGLAVAGAWWR